MVQRGTVMRVLVVMTTLLVPMAFCNASVPGESAASAGSLGAGGAGRYYDVCVSSDEGVEAARQRGQS